MANESNEVRVMGTGSVYVGEEGATFPANITAAIASTQFAQLGFLSEEGPRFAFGKETKDIQVWQSLDPVRTITTAVPKSVKFDLMQTNLQTVTLALGGGTVTLDTADAWSYEPPAIGFQDVRAMIVEGIDGDYVWRFCYRRTQNMSGVEFAFVNDDAVKFGIEMKILAADSGASPFFIQTDDPNFSPTGTAS